MARLMMSDEVIEGILFAHINRLNREIEALNTEILALQIQAAESEDRAEDEKHKRIQLLMRI